MYICNSITQSTIHKHSLTSRYTFRIHNCLAQLVDVHSTWYQRSHPIYNSASTTLSCWRVACIARVTHAAGAMLLLDAETVDGVWTLSTGGTMASWIAEALSSSSASPAGTTSTYVKTRVFAPRQFIFWLLLIVWFLMLFYIDCMTDCAVYVL